VIRFSVVVPMRSVEAFVDECLWSVRCQAGVELEIVAVDDNSPDGCGAIADRHAAEDDRVTVLHLERTHGVGPARNEGIARARGEYLLFLDADDTFRGDDFLAGLDADLAAAGEPDVLLFDYEEQRPCGLSRWIRVSDAERPGVLRASWVCWNKAYRREFVAGAGLRFPSGYYEDFAWSIPALLAADRIAVAGRVGVGYRRCVATSVSRGVSQRHFEVFDQFERVLAFLAAHPEYDSAEAREVLAASARNFLHSRTEQLQVIPPELVGEFRRRSVEITGRLSP
jgi:glycosyltransferase involved in cell wall biosynthesis